MSLYDGLDLDNKHSNNSSSAVPAGWSQGYKLLHSQLKAKKASLTQLKPPKPKQRSGAIVSGVSQNKVEEDVPVTFNLLTGKMDRMVSQAIHNTAIISNPMPFIASEALTAPSFTGVTDEYNPLLPNEYDDLVKRKKDKKDEERRQDNDERRRTKGSYGKELDNMRRKKEEEEEEEEIDRSRGGGGGGATIAPPPSVLEDTDIKAFGQPEGMNTLNTVATKIMAKYGYKEGQGLGKSEQGMSTALYVEKTSKRGGKIIHEKDMPKGSFLHEGAHREPQSNTNLLRNPSKVILLTNMVGLGEVDDELETETAEECSKYGKVAKVIIFEVDVCWKTGSDYSQPIKMPDYPDDEAVRIFIEFERMESAIKAIVDLNGRYFGGRVVNGSFFNLDRFRRLDLSCPVDD